MADLPGGASGLPVRDYNEKKADRLVTRMEPRVVSLVAELRGHERQAAEELGQWKNGVEERKPPTPRGWRSRSPCCLPTRSWTRWKRALEVEKSRWAADQVDQMSQALNRLRAMGSLPKYSPPMPRPRQVTTLWMA
jgi:hypothetical protein